ncbi:RHS repeat-associated core domain-containing protein [Lentzea sp. NPDC051838]|uniref:RHS repeat-associated core domain-containing protein n=1 Tax=Lentzea sp. NPDC051838 TaxID=3154849 RepID=UPI003420B3E1
MKLKRALIRGMTVCLALTMVTVSVDQAAIAAGSPSVNAPDVKSVAVSNGSLGSRGQDEATTRALKGNQPAGGTQQGGGSFAATPFSASSSWEVSRQSGDFSWSYPLRVPPAPGGFSPSLALSYRSSAVDGLTSVTNNQPSWVGEGWDLSAGYVERAYGGCSSDTEGGTTPPKTGDLCWRSDNATASFGGRGGMLIKDDATGAWRLKADDRSRIERTSTPGNGDKFNESWKITTVDGTQYFFGTRTGAKSTWTVPVFGDDDKDPCHESTFAASSCDRAWRWMLDKVVDPRGNVVLYNYETETNKYGKNREDAAASYVRAGTLKSVEYGLRDDVNAPASGRVEFGLENRCVKDANCSDYSIKENWPDAAVADNCDAATCHDKNVPTFWSTKRLSTITTQVRKGNGYQNVDRWTLQHEFPKTDDVYQAALWLRSITHTGLVGGELPLPDVTFEGTKMPNRVDAPTGIGPLNRYRVTGVVSESGGVTTVKYANPDCVPGTSMPANPESNDKRCYPSKWTPLNGAEREDYFHKYVVESITTSDRYAASTEQLVRYQYLDGAAWRRDQSEFTKDDKRTYNEFRGYGRVRVLNGRDNDLSGPVTMSEERFYRGMHGDKLPGGGTRTANVTDTENGTREDSDWLSGFRYESQQHDGTSDTVLSKTISTPTWSGPTATRGDYKAYWTAQESSTSYTALRSGGWRKTRTESKYDGHGQATESKDLGDLATADDDRCTTTSYLQDEPRWRFAYPLESETVAVACGTAASFPAQALGGVRNTYDNAGNITKVEEISDRPASGPVWKTKVTNTYDVYGRGLVVTNALGNATKTDYVPSTGGPTTSVVHTDALGHTVTTTIEPAWGKETKQVDANENVHEAEFDALGRATRVWLPDRTRADWPDQPSQSFAYSVQRDAPSSIKKTTVSAKGNYLTSTSTFDGLYRPLQTQSPTDGGRLVVDTRYDSQGRPNRVTQPFFNDKPVDTNRLVFSETDVPGLTRTEYDGAGRVQNSIYQVGGQEKWRTTTAYGGDRVDVTPPRGATPTTTITDARGQKTELWQYKGATASGDHDVARYSYTAAGQLASTTDAAGNTWKWQYDLRGRQIRAEDVDKGVSTTTYDALDRVESITDPNSGKLAYGYDKLNRKISVKSGATLLQEFTYDTADYGLGLPASSTRYVDGNAYISRVLAYDPLDRPLLGEVVIPDAEGPLKGVYKSTFQYNPDGSLQGEVFGAIPAADLPSETVLHQYDDLGRPSQTVAGLSGTTSDMLVNSTAYTRYGEQYRVELGVTGKRTWLSYYYDDNTRRMNRYIVDAEVPSPKQADVNYGYDDAGNALSVTDNTVLGVDRQCFRYDHLQRLTQAWTPSTECSTDPSTAALGGPAPYWQSFEYDAVGNRKTEVQHATGGDTTRTYNYARAHELESVTSTGPGGSRLDRFTYDAAGNTKTRNLAGAAQTLDWDVEGRVSKVAEGTKETKFVYGTNGSRLLRRDPDGTTLYLAGQEIRLAKGATKPSVTRYYTHGGHVVAMREGATKITWLANDHQGTAQIAVNRDSMAVERRRQLPFGAPRGGVASFPGERGFVGGTNDASTGLTQLGARQYDPVIGRFISVDPILATGDPQQWNGYAYSNNSPVTFSDPSGLLAMGCMMDGPCSSQPGGTKSEQTPAPLMLGGDAPGDDMHTRWTKANSPATNDVNRLIDIFSTRTVGYSYGIDYWHQDMGDGHAACYGRQACQEAWIYLVEHPDDVAGAKEIAANYCADNFTTCSKGATWEDVAGEFANMALGGATAMRIRAGAASRTAPSFCRPNSFTGDTLVLMADGSMKPIGQVEVGDEVASSLPEVASTERHEVVAVIVTDADKEYVDLTVSTPGGPKVIRTTAHHPFYNSASKQWEDAGELETGDLLNTPGNGRAELVAVRHYIANMRTYNLTVDSVHTYYVVAGETPVLVHNQNCANVIAGPRLGSLRVSAAKPSAAELRGAQEMAARGNDVVLRDPVGTRKDGDTSDLLVNGVRWDVYSPKTGNADRIVSAVASKGSQVHGGGVIVDLSRSSVTADQLANIEARVFGTGGRVGQIVVLP